MAEVAFHPEAQQEYEAAFAWYNGQSPRAAGRFEAEVQRVVRMIGADPEMFARSDEEHRFAVLQRFPYSLVYRRQGPTVVVIAVAHGGREPDYWRGRT